MEFLGPGFPITLRSKVPESMVESAQREKNGNSTVGIVAKKVEFLGPKVPNYFAPMLLSMIEFHV